MADDEGRTTVKRTWNLDTPQGRAEARLHGGPKLNLGDVDAIVELRRLRAEGGTKVVAPRPDPPEVEHFIANRMWFNGQKWVEAVGSATVYLRGNQAAVSVCSEQEESFDPKRGRQEAKRRLRRMGLNSSDPRFPCVYVPTMNHYPLNAQQAIGAAVAALMERTDGCKVTVWREPARSEKLRWPKGKISLEAMHNRVLADKEASRLGIPQRESQLQAVGIGNDHAEAHE
jgi:hypothetical protein